MDKYRVIRRSRGTMVLCLYSYAAGHTKMGVCRIPIPENQAIVDRKTVSGWLVSGQSDG